MGPSLGLHKGAGFAPAVTPQFSSVRSHKKGALAVRSGATARSPTRIFWTDAGAKHIARAPTCSHTFSVRRVPNSPDAISGMGRTQPGSEALIELSFNSPDNDDKHLLDEIAPSAEIAA